MDRFEQIVKIRLGIVKEGFPIPSPNGGETQEEYIARCNKELYNDHPDDSQRNAICYAEWEKK